MTSGDCEEVDKDLIRDFLGNRSEKILSEDVTSKDNETFKKLFKIKEKNSDDLFSELLAISNKTQNCSNPYILTMGEMGDSRPLSEEVISWVLATLPMGAMVSIRIKLSLHHHHP